MHSSKAVEICVWALMTPAQVQRIGLESITQDIPQDEILRKTDKLIGELKIRFPHADFNKDRPWVIILLDSERPSQTMTYAVARSVEALGKVATAYVHKKQDHGKHDCFITQDAALIMGNNPVDRIPVIASVFLERMSKKNSCALEQKDSATRILNEINRRFKKPTKNFGVYA